MSKRRIAHVPGLVPKRPPRYRPGDQVVMRGYESGWRWKVLDAELCLPPVRHHPKARQKTPAWLYRIQAQRPTDGRLVEWTQYEWTLRDLPKDDVA